MVPRLFDPEDNPPGQDAVRTVACVIDWFLVHDRAMRSHEAKAERARILGLFKAFVNSDGRQLGSLFTGDCRGADLVEFLNRDNLAQWTRRRWCSTVKRPFREAARLGLISHSPFAAVTERRGGRGRDITWDEYRCLLRLACPPMRRVLLFLRFSGARPEELRTLDWPHVDFALRQIVKREHKTAHTQSEPAPRVIPLNGPMVRLLLWLRRRRKDGDAVFLNSFGRRWTTQALCKQIWRLRKKIGLPAGVKLYGCRHAFITEAILNGVDVALVQQLAGHANISTTQIYLHLAGKNDHLAVAMARAVRFGGPAAANDEQQQLIEALLAVLRSSSARG